MGKIAFFSLFLCMFMSPRTSIIPAGEGSQENATVSAGELAHRLKDSGILLVRLHTSQPALDALKAQGETALAQQKKQAQKDENLAIMGAFRKEFSFCHVYFFYSDKTDQVMQGAWDGIFLNSELAQDSSIHPSSLPYYVAEFGERPTNYGSSRRGLKLMSPDFRDLTVEGLPQDGFFWEGKINWKQLRFVSMEDMVAELNTSLQDVITPAKKK